MLFQHVALVHMQINVLDLSRHYPLYILLSMANHFRNSKHNEFDIVHYYELCRL
jgi:hypothetical protein